jgi:hypothetical protein
VGAHRWLKLSHPAHSGRLRPHEHTSYLPLFLLLMIVGSVLVSCTAAALSPPPAYDSVGLTGTVPGKPPTVAATITSPANGARFTSSPVNIKGTCPKATLVEIFKNDIFAGSTICSDTGTYSLDIDLLIGKNTLFARVHDALNQPGPDSEKITVFYDALPGQAAALAPLNFGGAQLLLNTDAVFRGTFPGKEMVMPLDIIGGAPPYAVNIQWGDASNKVIPRKDNATFNAVHTYTKPGTYQVNIQGTDSADRVAFLSVATIINGTPAGGAIASGTKATTNKLLVLWPLYAAVLTAIISFWLGESREKKILTARGQLSYS